MRSYLYQRIIHSPTPGCLFARLPRLSYFDLHEMAHTHGLSRRNPTDIRHERTSTTGNQITLTEIKGEYPRLQSWVDVKHKAKEYGFLVTSVKPQHTRQRRSHSEGGHVWVWTGGVSGRPQFRDGKRDWRLFCFPAEESASTGVNAEPHLFRGGQLNQR
jgi:hypothetical protein